MKEYIIGVDPGIGQTGICLLRSTDFHAEILYVDAPKFNEEYWIDEAHNIGYTIVGCLSRVPDPYSGAAKIAIEKPIIRFVTNKLFNQFAFIGALLAAIRSKTPNGIYLVYPKSAKLSLVNGIASKTDMVNCVKEDYQIDLKKLEYRKPEREAIADSVGIALAVAKKLNGVERLC